MALREGTAKSIMATGLKVANRMDAQDKVLLRRLERKIVLASSSYKKDSTIDPGGKRGRTIRYSTS